MAELYVVRHGQASFGAEDYDQLSTLGEQQALLLGQYFAERDIHFDRVMTGTLKRHHQTAQAIIEGAGWAAPVAEHPGFDEYDFKTLVAVACRLQPQLSAWFDSCDKKSFYKGMRAALFLWLEGRLDGAAPERWNDFKARVCGALTEVRQSGAGRTLAISSGGAMGLATQQIVGGPDHLAIDLNMQLFNTGVCRYFYNRERIRLATFNGTPHLEHPAGTDLITYA
ncbi:MAG: histidine phosphatase family protein [Oceanospirillaceae bacterium]|nr:histidine phosphatase family protein [Oceanospirillaceae bacterium]